MGADEDWSHTSEFGADASNAGGARAFVTRHLLEHGQADLVDDIQLVVSELATNALLHARAPYAVVLAGLNGSVRVEVLDGSPTGPVMVSAREPDTGGRGIAIVDALSRGWGVVANASGGKSVWAEFDRV